MKVYSIVTGTVRSIRQFEGGVRRIQVEHQTKEGEYMQGFVTEFNSKENPARNIVVGQILNAAAFQSINTYEKKNGEIVHEIKTTLLSEKAEKDLYQNLSSLFNAPAANKKDVKIQN